ncbi:MAG: hypothetical protein QOF28_516, partial [Actinomycetota bacterium]|nr:hypothetical protein [Actinomycetota bacterium]
IQTRDEGVVYDWHEQQWQFEVMNPDRTVGIVAMPLTVKVVPNADQKPSEGGGE